MQDQIRKQFSTFNLCLYKFKILLLHAIADLPLVLVAGVLRLHSGSSNGFVTRLLISRL